MIQRHVPVVAGDNTSLILEAFAVLLPISTVAMGIDAEPGGAELLILRVRAVARVRAPAGGVVAVGDGVILGGAGPYVACVDVQVPGVVGVHAGAAGGDDVVDVQVAAVRGLAHHNR